MNHASDMGGAISRLEQLIAVLAVIGIHALLLLVLAGTDGYPASPTHPQDARIALLLLDRPDIEVPRSSATARSTRIPVTREADDAPSTPSRAVGFAAPREAPALSMPSTPEAALDLSVRAPEIQFSTHSLRRPVSSHFATAAPLLRLTFEDASLIGKMAGMSKRMACSELQHALASHPESAESIVNTMKQRGCAR